MPHSGAPCHREGEKRRNKERLKNLKEMQKQKMKDAKPYGDDDGEERGA